MVEFDKFDNAMSDFAELMGQVKKRLAGMAGEELLEIKPCCGACISWSYGSLDNLDKGVCVTGKEPDGGILKTRRHWGSGCSSFRPAYFRK
jgi:hypothetical protein